MKLWLTTLAYIGWAQFGRAQKGKFDGIGPRHADPVYSFPLNQPLVALDATTAFAGLTPNQQRYAHHLSRASFLGGLIVLLQTSVESPQIYRLIQAINNAESVAEFKERALKVEGITEEDFQAYLVYCSGIFNNMGNYKGFGDFKFVPDLNPEQFKKIIQASKAYTQDKTKINKLWESVKEEIFLLNSQTKQLGLGNKGVTKYFTSNCNETDSAIVNRFMKKNNIEAWISRVMKTTTETGKNMYEIRNAGVEKSQLMNHTDFEGAEFSVTSGDYGPLLELVNQELQMAVDAASNDNEKQMITKYMESFKTGSIDAHKDGSRFWIKNKSPAVETYIGFIETYRDPAGARGEFEGFVAMVNKEQSVKFQGLVDKAEILLPRLPWPKEFEKDKFLRPDFTSLDVLTFAGSSIPAGINIPNYDEIRQVDGFKNVNLGNVVSSGYKTSSKTLFVNAEDDALYKKFRIPSFELKVGLHELLGHGSGKLLYPGNHEENLINPLTNKTIEQTYHKGETYNSKFTTIASSYEECKAECVGLYLSSEEEVLKNFGHTDPKNKTDVVYINYLSLVLRAIKSLDKFSPHSGEWKQAHGQARFVMTQVMLEAGQGFLTVKQVTGEDGKPDLLVTMNKEKLMSVGRPAIGNLLEKLQIYKSTGNAEEARKMYMKYSAVDNSNKDLPWLDWRKIVLERQKPRKMWVQANTEISGDKLKLKTYEPSVEGMFQSWRERFTPEEHQKIDIILDKLYSDDKDIFAEK